MSLLLYLGFLPISATYTTYFTPPFLNVLRASHGVAVPVKGNFLVKDSTTVEVGGKNKDEDQIRGVETPGSR